MDITTVMGMLPINTLLCMAMIVVPFGLLLWAGHKEAKQEDIEMHQARTMVRTIYPPYDWANPIELMDYDVLMFDCPADPTYTNQEDK